MNIPRLRSSSRAAPPSKRSTDRRYAGLRGLSLARTRPGGPAPRVGARVPAHTMRGVSEARFGSVVARGVAQVSHDPADLTEGFWVVVVTFEGRLTAVRMAEVERGAQSAVAGRWTALDGTWHTSLDRDGYLEGVDEIRRRIAAGTVY